MILKIFSVYDSKAEAYLQPFFFQSRGQAVRAFTDSANDPKHMFGRHPGDYTLFEIGEWMDDSAMFSEPTMHTNLGVAIEFANSPNEGY